MTRATNGLSVNGLIETAIVDLIRRVVGEELDRRDAVRVDPPGLVTVAEYARRRSISASGVRLAIREGRLPATRIGRSVRVAADAEIANRSRPEGEPTTAAVVARILAGTAVGRR